MNEQTKSVGLVGAGLMGSGIAASLLRHRYSLLILEHSGNQPLEPLKAAGARSACQIADLTAQCDVIILCVTGTPQVEAVLFEEHGVLSTLRADTLLIDCSTAVPSSTLRISEAVQAAGGRFVDAAMTRTPKEAAEGRLNLIVGGSKGDFDSCLPLLQAFAENIVHAGPVGAGHQMKLLHNFVSLGFSAVLAEAAACARRSGTDPQVFCEVLASGGGGGIVLDRLRPFIEAGDVANFRFSMANALKDLEYYCTMAEQQGGSHLIAQSVRERYSQASDAGLSQAPVPHLVDFLTDS